MKSLLFLFLSLLLFSCGSKTQHKKQQEAPLPFQLEPLLEETLKGIPSCLVIYDVKTGHSFKYNAKRCIQKYSPKSTFKIPNSIIALKTGVIRNISEEIAWDSLKYPKQPGWGELNWNRDHHMASAFKYSVVWYYQEVAERIGKDNMKKYLHRFNYGNADISGGLTRFWLTGSLKISANEQVDFLRKFYVGGIEDVSQSTTLAVKEIMLQEQTGQYKLSYKTGGGQIANGNTLGWVVGYLENPYNTYIFAFNMEGEDFSSVRSQRVELLKESFRKLRLL